MDLVDEILAKLLANRKPPASQCYDHGKSIVIDLVLKGGRENALFIGVSDPYPNYLDASLVPYKKVVFVTEQEIWYDGAAGGIVTHPTLTVKALQSDEPIRAVYVVDRRGRSIAKSVMCEPVWPIGTDIEFEWGACSNSPAPRSVIVGIQPEH